MSLTSKQVDELREYAKGRKGELAKLIKDAADTIELLSAKLSAVNLERSSQYYHGGWIPCSERLPDVAQRVLLSGHGQVMVGMLHSFGKYSLEPTGISYVYPKDDIEAWMPLPEPYQEKPEVE